MPKASKYLFGNSEVEIVLADILEADAEVVVSSDDDQLSMGGGVSKTLRIAGGERLIQDSKNHVPAAVGRVVVTSAGDLPFKHVFHAITRKKGTPPSEDREENRRVIS